MAGYLGAEGFTMPSMIFKSLDTDEVLPDDFYQARCSTALSLPHARTRGHSTSRRRLRH